MDNHGKTGRVNSPEIHPDDGSPNFPMKVFVYRKDGTYGAPVVVESDEELKSPRIKGLIRDAFKSGVEVRITDPDDYLLFHANNGRIIFDGKALREQ